MNVDKRTIKTCLATVVASLAFAGSAVAGLPQADNQLCYKFKDVNAVTGDDVAATFSSLNCNVKVKAAYWCAPYARNSDDDLRGGLLGQSVCYKLKCEQSDATIVNLILDTFIGTHGAQDVDWDKPKFVCMPVGND